jgi:hypothetical protein
LAFAYVGDRGFACDVIDVSYNGCRIACVRDVELPEVIELHVVGETRATKAWVRWRKGREAGLSFSPIAESVAV